MNSLGRIATTVAVVAAIGGAAAYAVSAGWVDLGHVGEPRNVVDINGQTVALPTPADDPERLAPAIVTDATGDYSFMTLGADGPIRHDPCRAIHWKLSTAGMPPGAEEWVNAAVASVAEHTGLVWIYDGYTGSPASFDSPLLVNNGEWDYAPVVIGWAVEGDQVDLEGDTAGVGGSRVVQGAYGDAEFLRSGAVIVDTAGFPGMIQDSDDGARLQSVVMHELGHVVGLDHSSDPAQLMFAAATSTAQWGAGDLQGLALAGAGPCEVD